MPASARLARDADTGAIWSQFNRYTPLARYPRRPRDAQQSDPRENHGQRIEIDPAEDQRRDLQRDQRPSERADALCVAGREGSEMPGDEGGEEHLRRDEEPESFVEAFVGVALPGDQVHAVHRVAHRQPLVGQRLEIEKTERVAGSEEDQDHGPDAIEECCRHYDLPTASAYSRSSPPHPSSAPMLLRTESSN